MKGKYNMDTYRVWGWHKVCCYVDIEANSAEEAMKIADGISSDKYNDTNIVDFHRFNSYPEKMDKSLVLRREMIK